MSENCICLCRVRCQRKSLSGLLQFIYNTLADGEPLNPIDDTIFRFYTYTGPAVDPKRWGRVLEEAFGSKFFTDNKSWRWAEDFHFRQADNRQVICELVINSQDDLSNIQYLLLALHALHHNSTPFTVLISGGRRNSERYAPLGSDDYFRLSHQMYFYAPFFSGARGLPDLYSRFFVCSKIKKGRQNYWIQLPKKYSSEIHFGRIIPQIPITHQSYLALVSSYGSDLDGGWSELLLSLCEGYYNRLLGVFADNKNVIDAYKASDSYFETTLFLSLCCYISEDPASTGINKEDIDSLHETCMDFAQGVLQLIDNVVSHVLGNNEADGCGILTVRFRKSNDARELYITDPDKFQGVDHFMELCLTDLQYGNFMGVVEKFKDNVRNRRERYRDEHERRFVHAKFYLSQNVDEAGKIIKEEPKDLRNRLRDYIHNTVCEDVTLADFFGEGSCRPFLDYVSDAENIAFHYGLPILNSVVLLQEGYLHVQSGAGEPNRFDNVQEGRPYSRVDDLIWDHGTAFVIYLPLRLRRPIGEFDSLVPIKNDTPCQYNHIDFSPFDLPRLGTRKDDLALWLKEQIEEEFNSYGDGDAEIGVIDCGQMVDILNISRLDAYEVIVKALFLYLAEKSAIIDNLALINITQAYDVIKLFRLFALFFDRVGKNSLLSKNKSLFLVDCDGKVDILFYGNNLKSIRDSLSVSRLYGGTAENAVRIIRQLLEGRYE